MEIRQLKYFVLLARELNFGRAANLLHITQPPLSRKIQQLEEELGVRLFERTPKGVKLTAAGSQLQEDADGIISLMQRAAERARLTGSGQLGRLDIGIFGSAVLNVIPQLMVAFHNAYPEVTLVLHTMNKTQQISALQENRLTIGFNRLIPETDGLVIEPILTECILLAINSEHKLASKMAVPFAEIADLPLILFPNMALSGFADYVISLFENEGFKPNVIQKVDDAVTAVALASSGFGITLVPESCSNLKLPGVTYIPLKLMPPPTIDISCVYRENDNSPTLNALLGVIRTQYKN